MKKIFFSVSLLAAAAGHAQKDYPIQGVVFTQVRLQDQFWLPRIRTNHEVTIPASFARCETTGRIRNFEMAAARSGKFCTTFPFDDTDIYKTIEGASYSLRLFPDKKMEAYIDTLIGKIAAAQEPDGYLYTARTIDPTRPHSWAGASRWEKERELSHELYNSGHLYEAAAAHYYATGKKNLLDIALKNADLVCSVFGPDKLRVAPGHQVVEMGLVKLYRITGRQDYLQTARFFIDERGHHKGYDAASKDPWKSGAYWQDHKPVTEQKEAVGHAVRAGYLYAAVADIAALTGEKKYLQAVDSIWNNVVQKKLYIQGGLGAIPEGERFGDNYELPNATAYNETCAAISNVYWNYRMFLLHGDAGYFDVLERTLYNGLLSGVGMDGKTFFYTNAMQVKNNSRHHSLEPERSGWFECSCCPTNITRLMPSIPGYVYAQRESDVYVNLFMSSYAQLAVNKKKVVIEQRNNYPWEGNLTFNVSPVSPHAFTLRIRIPGWSVHEAVPSDLYRFAGAAAQKPEILLNGKPVAYEMEKGYAVLQRTWRKGDVVAVQLPMEVKRVLSHEKIQDNRGRVALQRGPLVYCAEWKDNEGSVSNRIIPDDARFSAEHLPGLLQGLTVLRAVVPAVMLDAQRQEVSTAAKTLTMIPYYAWAHRGKGEMMIWFPARLQGIDLIANP